MNDASRRDFLKALGLVPLLAATIAAKKPAPSPAPSPSSTPTPSPDDALKELRAFELSDGSEPATVFAATRGNR